MKHIKAENDIIIQYPYTMSDLLQDHPNVSFPHDFQERAELLASYNVYPVNEVTKPSYDMRTQEIIKHTSPVYNDGIWTIGWDIIQKSTEEIAHYDNLEEDFVRNERDKRLSETDWMAMSDRGPLAAEWAKYRQDLRDITDQPGFPHDVVWPAAPEII